MPGFGSRSKQEFGFLSIVALLEIEWVNWIILERYEHASDDLESQIAEIRNGRYNVVINSVGALDWHSQKVRLPFRSST